MKLHIYIFHNLLLPSSSQVFALIRYTDDPQKFSIEYSSGPIRRYAATDRDALLCSILDGVRASGNRDICVKMRSSHRGKRLGPLNLPVEEEVESQFLKYVGNTPQGGRGTCSVTLFIIFSIFFSLFFPLIVTPFFFFALGVRFASAVESFNSNVGYSGLNHAVTQEVTS